MGSAISSLNAWSHTPRTLRGAYVLGYGALFGANIWNSFIGGIVAFRYLPRQVFGNLQSRLFPIFFLYTTIGSLSLLTIDLKLRPALLSSFKSAPLATLSALNGREFWSSTAGLSLVGAVVAGVNGIWVTPSATNVMFERHRLERIEGKTPEASSSTQMKDLNKRFSRLHGASTTLNMVGLIATGLIGWRIGTVGIGPRGAGGLGITP